MDVPSYLKLSLLSCILLLSSSQILATGVHYCDKKAVYAVKVKGVEISPNPVVRGKPATFKISAATGEAISGGKLVIEVSYFGVHIHTETHDLCEEASCPVTAVCRSLCARSRSNTTFIYPTGLLCTKDDDGG